MGKKKYLKVVIPIVLVAVVVTAILFLVTGRKVTEDVNELVKSDIKTGSASEGVSLHDPMVFMGEDGRYYMFGSHMTEADSDDLFSWNMLADGVRKSNKMFTNLFDDSMDAFSFVGKNEDNGYSVWAPSIIYNKAMGKYVMYFCTTSTYIKSNICFATADDPAGPYTYQDTILYSGFMKSTVDKTDFYEVMGEGAKLSDYAKSGSFQNNLWPNCIDPALFYDEDGRMWMVYGSWSGGIFLIEIDEETGDVIHPEADAANNVDTYYGKRLIGGGHHSIEGPYIQYDEESGYYYLFVSYGVLTSNGGYQIREFRSETVDGTYVDAAGNTLGNEDNYQDFGVKMMGNYTLPSLDVTYMAPGGQSSFTDADGKMYLVYHQRFADGTENHEPRIHQIFANEDGWMVAAPFETNGETLSEEGYETKDLCGTFYILNHGLDVSDKKRNAKECTFVSDGTITGEYEGSFAVTEGTNYITVTIDGAEYKGVLIQMEDEAGNNTLCLTATGADNKTIWGVHYMK